MQNENIRLAYRYVIDAQASALWDQYVFEDTYREYRMQQQLYNDAANPKATFRELLAENDKAEKLHYLTGIAAHSYVQQLKGKLPRVPDVLGKNFFPFTNYEFDLINSDVQDSARHKFGLTFYSPLLRLLDVVGNCYLVSLQTDERTQHETLMFPLQNRLSICYVED